MYILRIKNLQCVVFCNSQYCEIIFDCVTYFGISIIALSW